MDHNICAGYPSYLGLRIVRTHVGLRVGVFYFVLALLGSICKERCTAYDNTLQYMHVRVHNITQNLRITCANTFPDNASTPYNYKNKNKNN